MIDPTAKLSVSRQAILPGISRGRIYYQNSSVPDADLKLMHRIDKLPMKFPFAGGRMSQGLRVQKGFSAGRLHVATLMKRMGMEALYRKPNTSKPVPGHKTYPHILRKLPITRPNQVWPMEITPASGKQSTGLFYDPPHPDGARVHISRRCSGLVHPPRAVLAGIDHAGGRWWQVVAGARQIASSCCTTPGRSPSRSNRWPWPVVADALPDRLEPVPAPVAGGDRGPVKSRLVLVIVPDDRQIAQPLEPLEG